MSKRSDSCAELKRPGARRSRLSRELSLLSSTPNDGPRFAALTGAVSSAIAAVLPPERPPMPPLRTMLSEAAYDLECAAGHTGWQSEMERAGHLHALLNAHSLFFRSLRTGHCYLQGPVAYPPPATSARQACERVVDLMGIILAHAPAGDGFKSPGFRPYIARLADVALLQRLGAARAGAEDALEQYNPPMECWALIVAAMSSDTARAFAACAQWTRELVAPRWRRLLVRGPTLLPSVPSMPPIVYPNVRRIVFDFLQTPPARNAAAAMAAVVASCPSEALTVRLHAQNELVLSETAEVRPLVRRLTVYASSSVGRQRSTGTHDICTHLKRAFDFSQLQRLALRGRYPIRAMPLSLLQLPSLTELAVDAEGLPMLERAPLARLFRLQVLRLRDRNGQLESPMSKERCAVLFAPAALWCETANDASVVVDALADNEALASTGVDADGVSTGFVLSRIHYGRREMQPLRCVTQLDVAQHDYDVTDAANERSANDAWFARHFPSLPLPPAD